MIKASYVNYPEVSLRERYSNPKCDCATFARGKDALLTGSTLSYIVCGFLQDSYSAIRSIPSEQI